ncbi:MAG: phage integrase SAM-like domain-containing protein [Rikenellaceae bacterium]
MAKITKSLSAKVDKQTGRVEILFRFVGSSSIILRAKSGIFIDPKSWNAKKSELKSAFGNEQAQTKLKLDALCNTIITSFTDTDREQITKEWLNTTIDKFHYPEKYNVVEVEQKPTFFDVFEEFLQVRKFSEARRNSFKVVLRSLKRFELYKGITLDLETTTNDTIREFETFLRDEHTLCKTKRYGKILEQVPESRTPQPRGQNAINNILVRLRTFWIWCAGDGQKCKNLPKIKINECVYGTPFYISVEERKQIESADLSAHPSLEIQRDIFVFQCCIGCRVGDLYKFTPQNVVDGAIQYVPRKTKEGRPVTVTVPLNSVALEIIKRYAYSDPKRLLPYISEQRYNDAIKRIFELSGIDRIVQVRNPLTGESDPRPIYEVASSHLARRTFVGNLYKRVKDPNLVGALSGHKEGSKAFARYRDIDNEMKVELVKLLE